MRVLHVIPSIAPRYGGPSAAMLGYASALGARGVDVLIATTNADGEGTLPVPIGDVIAYQGVPAVFFPRRGERFKWSAPLAAWLGRSVGDFDLVHVHAVFSHSSLAAARACRRAGVPYVVRPLGSLNPWALGRKAWRKRLLFWTSVKTMLAGAAAVHYTTAEERRNAEDAVGRLPAFVIPLGVDEAALEGDIVPPGQRDRIVLALTRLHPVKNLEALIDAFADASAAAADWTLVIAGAGEATYRAALEARARSRAADRVRFIGWIEGAAKVDLLSRAAVFALPSHTENFGAGLLEALARGVPAIVSRDVNLAREVDDAGAGWIVQTDAGSIAAALRDAMTRDDERAARSAAARAFAARFTWSAVAAALEAQYAALVSQA